MENLDKKIEETIKIYGDLIYLSVEKLILAVKDENYEEAAKLRDIISLYTLLLTKKLGELGQDMPQVRKLIDNDVNQLIEEYASI